MDVTFRLAQQMHWAPASSASRASQDGTLATLSLRWHHVNSPCLVPYIQHYGNNTVRYYITSINYVITIVDMVHVMEDMKRLTFPAQQLLMLVSCRHMLATFQALLPCQPVVLTFPECCPCRCIIVACLSDAGS